MTNESPKPSLPYSQTVAKPHRLPLTIEILLGKGYFPKELPLCFNTRLFAIAAANIHITSNKKPSSKCVPFPIPQRNLGRRTLDIPNPLHQLQLSRTIIEHWNTILTFVDTSSISLSRLETFEDSTRAIEPYHKSEHDGSGWTLGHMIREARIEAALSARYCLIADIANFYTSIYTHSIPWALHGKEVSKQRRKRNNLLGNAIDEDIRNCRDKQTSGIPVGPDTSRIVSEIIGTAIDLELKRRLEKLSGIRFYDDYYLYFETLADLEEGYSQLQDVLQEYELKLNLSKVQKLDLRDESFDKPWVNSLRKFIFRLSSNPIAQRNDLVHYFDLTTRLALRFPEDPIFYYAIQRISTVFIQQENRDIFINLLLRSLQLNTRAVHVICKLLLRHKRFIQFEPKIKKLVTDSLNYLILQHVRLQNAYEVSWGLWLLRSLNAPLQRQVVEPISRFRNAMVTILASDLQDSGLTEGGLNFDVWQETLKKAPDVLYGTHWLLIYEAATRKWPIKGPESIIQRDEFFCQLNHSNVSFYDPNVAESVKKAVVPLNREEKIVPVNEANMAS